MEPTVCPWCQTEIVWDEEIGPEENCPHCDNELKGYRTLNIELEGENGELDNEEHAPEEDDEYESGDILNKPFWGIGDGTVPAIRVLDKYGDDHDLMAYEESVESVLDDQDETPECFHCREYMMLAGTQKVSGEAFEPALPASLQAPLLKPPFHLNVYICSGCFQVQYTLSEDDRLRLIKGLTGDPAQ
ncbi:hypothetical protein [Paenibacillus sp. DMB20]|uniref:hypothetical protein n=1 Tax=Paenibacillus sp. DMB20 TaxID=1642570 RepID=UPI000627CD85|nr:hypothetical protein [Paenibacillus sp. DMB20]KKO52936.1 hypothetical protein XI25_17225 [Paenibacillus sp. DMB20]KKO53584.1 hypothetical protein XI25_11250 [Paenibacillus sp. DMB20]